VDFRLISVGKMSFPAAKLSKMVGNLKQKFVDRIRWLDVLTILWPEAARIS
jgi:hypothetical protein